MSSVFYVNVYELDRCYGGPEEGGWWYDEGRHVYTVTAFTEGWADVLAARLADDKYPSNGNRGYVNYGRHHHPRDYEIRVEKEPGEDWNNYRPYE